MLVADFFSGIVADGEVRRHVRWTIKFIGVNRTHHGFFPDVRTPTVRLFSGFKFQDIVTRNPIENSAGNKTPGTPRNFMHENRETSGISAAQPGRRSVGEGKSHKSRTYVTEESHSGIVPMNHSNKGGASLAESEEGRPLIKENARQPNTYPTQSGPRVSQGLTGVRKAARESKG